MMKKAVLFDLDNTLYDYDPAHKKALKQTHKILKKHIKISFKRFLKLYDVSKAEIHKELSGTASAHNRILYFQRLIEKTENTVVPNIILELYDTYWNTFLKSMKLRKNAVFTLKKLKEKGLKIVIVSDLTTRIQLRKLKKLKIADYIDFLVTSEEAGSEKPHSIMFLLALNKLKILPKEALMVGDNVVADIEGANAVGLDTVLIKNKKPLRKQKEDYRNPNHVIKEIDEVLDLI
ncbi:HAD-IA family hydrolase [Candidatus Woesearchaeota archaeon]|nr:HAD-IA family hydrolase [Candidatus Woesearchaeota archaeon]